MSNAGGEVSQTMRKYYPKVKTGCKTCRIRRVKCDEKLPACLKYVLWIPDFTLSYLCRCTSTGRTCDGYPREQNHNQTQLLHRTQQPFLTLSNSPAMFAEFGENVQHLEFYHFCVGPMLSGRFDSDFWSNTILQLAHADAGVRSALIALGDLNQHESGSLQHARRCAASNKKKLERRAFWCNYNKAIRHLITMMSDPSFSTEVGLVICLLFSCIEFLRADAYTAFAHIRSGLNIVSEIRQRSTTGVLAHSSGIGRRSSSTALNNVEDSLVPILSQGLASALPYGASVEADFTFLERSPRLFKGNGFTCLKDARLAMWDLRNSAILLARDMAVKLYQSLPLTSSDHSRRDRILEEHHRFLKALIALEDSLELSVERFVTIGALKIGYYASYTACACISDKTQLSFDAHLISFRSLLGHAKDLINSWDPYGFRNGNPPPKAAANFTFDTSLIPALFYTAIRCRCPTTRREAIRLLAMDLPREGLWDPEQHRIVAERVIEIEEMEVDARGWPTKATRLCRSSVGTEVDDRNGFIANFLFTTDLNLAATKAWSERLTLSEGKRVPLSPCHILDPKAWFNSAERVSSLAPLKQPSLQVDQLNPRIQRCSKNRPASPTGR